MEPPITLLRTILILSVAVSYKGSFTESKRDPASDQLLRWREQNKDTKMLRTGHGAPIGNKHNIITAGPRGPLLMEDFVFRDEMSHFNHERIPERVVHAKGGGAHGYFEVTHDITHLCKAKVFMEIGKQTRILMRFSTVGGESGSADTARDPRGFAIKFYTEDGNWDLVGNNTPIFFIYDPLQFPSFIHTQKRNPKTHLKDADMFWDFLTLRPESTHQVMFLFGDRGTPDGFRHMHGYGSHTFKMVNKTGGAAYVKFHMRTGQKIKNLPTDVAGRLAGDDPDYAIRDLYNAIENKEYPTWTMYLQVMTFEQAERFRWNPFDLTKVWPQGEYPLQPVGKLVLDKNPDNYFAEIEQAAFAPTHMVPGIEPSPDRMLQGRLFSYPETHRHRLGPNYLQLPINRPRKADVKYYQRDGPQCMTTNQGGSPNYYPNSFNGPEVDPTYLKSKYSISADVLRYNNTYEDAYSQPRVFWKRVIGEDGQKRMIENLAAHIKNAAPFIQKRAVTVFSKVHSDMGKRLAKALDRFVKAAK